MHHGDAAGSVVGHVAGNRLTFLGRQSVHQRRLVLELGFEDAEIGRLAGTQGLHIERIARCLDALPIILIGSEATYATSSRIVFLGINLLLLLHRRVSAITLPTLKPKLTISRARFLSRTRLPFTSCGTASFRLLNHHTA